MRKSLFYKALPAVLILVITALSIRADDLKPTYAEVKYGPHDSNTLNFWKAESDKPTPVLIRIHGGGWMKGGKKDTIKSHYFLPHGISVASVDYRLLDKGILPAPVHDAARAVQFIRSKAREWNIDKDRIALMGSSAGACTALWLTYHDDLADPESDDPVARESTKPLCAIVNQAQSAIDPVLLGEWIGQEVLDHPMIIKCVGAENSKDMMDNYAKYKDLYKTFSAYYHVDETDPPVFMRYAESTKLPPEDYSHAIHHPMFGIKLREKCDAEGIECYILIKNECAPEKYRTERSFILDKVKQ